MQAVETKNEGLIREYRITVGAEEIANQMEEQLKGLSAKLKIPGFRPGHVPMNIMRQRYGDSVQADVLEKQVQQSTRQLMEEKKLRPAMPAKVDVQDYQQGGELVFNVSLEVLPEVPEFDFGKISLEREVAEVDEKDIKEGLERLAAGNKKLKAKEGKAAAGDVLTIDFVGKIDGVPFEGGTGHGVKLEIDSNHFIPGFEEQLKGAKKGDEKQVKVNFPEDYFKKELSGKPATFDVTVHEVSSQEAPEINDEFAKDMGFESLDKLKEAVRGQFESDYASMGRNRLKKSLFDKLEKEIDMPLPQAMVDAEFESIWKQVEQARKQPDSEFANKSEEELRKEYKAIAERRVKLGLILSDIGLKNKLTVTREELGRAMTEQARQFPGQEQKLFEFYQKNPGQLEELRGPILEDKAVDFILGKAKVTDRKISVTELLKDENAESGDEGKAAKKPKATKKKKEE
jgi:trigger factor